MVKQPIIKNYALRRLASMLLALSLPMIVAAFLSGSMSQVASFEPGSLLDTQQAQAASAPSGITSVQGCSSLSCDSEQAQAAATQAAHDSMQGMAGTAGMAGMGTMDDMQAPARETETESRTPQITITAQPTGSPQATGTAQATGTGTALATGTPGGVVQVYMQSHDVFSPREISVSVGTTVRWTNADEEDHTSTSDDGIWNSGVLHGGQSFDFVFTQSGDYHYTCLIHGAEMDGWVHVTGTGSTPTPQPSTTPQGGTVDIDIQNFAFAPQTITIVAGTIVRWTNLDSTVHTTASDTGLWDSGDLAQNQTFEFTFSTSGTYTFHCNRHPGMHGTINVVASGTTTPEATQTARSTQTAEITQTAQASATAQATNTPSAGMAYVNIQSYAYNPTTITVQAGTIVRWTNLDNDRHSITSDADLFDSGVLTLNQTFDFTFNTPGTYTYHCSVHGTFMTGHVVVTAGSGTETPSTTGTPEATGTPASTGTPAATETPLPTGTAQATQTTLLFSDVAPGDYFYTAVNWLANHSVISGYQDGTFRPYRNTTRGQLSKIIVLGEGWSTDTTGGPHFRDVGIDNPFYSYIETAYNRGIISGYQDGTFRWSNNVTRGQLSKIVVLAEGWSIDTTGGPHFSDVAIDNTFYGYIETAFNEGIISGYADHTFRYGNPATRGQISKIVYNAVTQP